MHAKSLSFLAIVSLFAVLTISAIPAQTQTAPAAAGNDLNAKAHAIFDKGVQLNGLTAKDMQPYHLKATYEIYEGDPTPEAGTLEVWSTAPDQWKRTYTGKEILRHRVERNRHRALSGKGRLQGKFRPRQA